MYRYNNLKCYIFFLIFLFLICFFGVKETVGKILPKTGECDIAFGILKGDTTFIEATSIKLKIEDGTTAGFKCSYNFTKSFSLEGSIVFSDNDIKAETGYKIYKIKLTEDIITLNGVYHILSGGIIPFITIGIGYINFESKPKMVFNPERNSVNMTQIHENDFLYNYGIGLKLFFKERFVFNVSIINYITKLKDTKSDVNLIGIDASIGLQF